MQREELLRLVEELPEDEAPVVLGDVAARSELLVPVTVVAEVGYLLDREAGPRVESLFLRSLADGDFSIVT